MLKHIKYFFIGLLVIVVGILIGFLISFIGEKITDEFIEWVKISIAFLILIGIIWGIGLFCHTFYVDVIKKHD